MKTSKVWLLYMKLQPLPDRSSGIERSPNISVVNWIVLTRRCQFFRQEKPKSNAIPKLCAFSKTHRPQNIYKTHNNLGNTANLQSNWCSSCCWMAAHWLLVINKSNNLFTEDSRKNVLNFLSENSHIITKQKICASPIKIKTGFRLMEPD